MREAQPGQPGTLTGRPEFRIIYTMIGSPGLSISVFAQAAQLLGMEALRRYFRLEVHGPERIPTHGPVVVVANHSGIAGLDALLLRHEIGRLTGRDARILAHRAWFAVGRGRGSRLPRNLGLVEAGMPQAMSVLREDRVLIVFPEAENGNFKPSREAYRLREFRPAFVRMAAEVGAPILPVAVRGAEEAHMNLASLELPPNGGVSLLPIPLNLVPLPSKWSFRFLDHVVPPGREPAREKTTIRDIAAEIRTDIGATLDEMPRGNAAGDRPRAASHSR